jgi:hypothetical protein
MEFEAVSLYKEQRNIRDTARKELTFREEACETKVGPIEFILKPLLVLVLLP